jgi:hypothetical protein
VPGKIILIISMFQATSNFTRVIPVVYSLLSTRMKLETENNSSDTNVRCADILE